MDSRDLFLRIQTIKRLAQPLMPLGDTDSSGAEVPGNRMANRLPRFKSRIISHGDVGSFATLLPGSADANDHASQIKAHDANVHGLPIRIAT
jgi:hypothetical protein